jgi:hypothetical protein
MAPTPTAKLTRRPRAAHNDRQTCRYRSRQAGPRSAEGPDIAMHPLIAMAARLAP